MHIQLILNKKLLNLDKNMNSAEIEVRKKFSNIPGNEIIFPIEDFYPFSTDDGTRLHTYRFPAVNPSALFINFHDYTHTATTLLW